MKLIDADALLKHAGIFEVKACARGCGNSILNFAKAWLWNEVNIAPTIDAVPVVRCRECKYWGDEDGKLQRSDGVLFARCKVHNYLIDGRHTGWCPTENDFCSYGERKDGAD